MEKYKNLKPDTWPGYRDIDEKEAAPNMDLFKAGFDDEIMDEDGEELDDDDSLSWRCIGINDLEYSILCVIKIELMN